MHRERGNDEDSGANARGIVIQAINEKNKKTTALDAHKKAPVETGGNGRFISDSKVAIPNR
jgi:hypothetical protein